MGSFYFIFFLEKATLENSPQRLHCQIAVIAGSSTKPSSEILSNVSFLYPTSFAP